MKLWLGILALSLNLIGYGPYIRDILRGQVKPHRVTWGVWTILTMIAAVNQVKNGGGYSSLFFISTAALVLVTFLLSLKYGLKETSTIDRLCLILALALLVYWVTVRYTRLSTLLAVIIDMLGAVPTVIKTYRRPETETYIQWALAGIGGLLSLLAITRVDWVLIIYPAYVFVMNGVIVLAKFAGDQHKTQPVVS